MSQNSYTEPLEMHVLERISIELTNRCSKACWFCYNHSRPDLSSQWTVEEILTLVRDCAAGGVKAVSFGGGEPLEYPGWFEVLTGLQGILFRSMTTNGKLLDDKTFDQLVAAAPDKVHVSIHFPGNHQEVDRVVDQVRRLEQRGIRSGINLLVMQSRLDECVAAAKRIRDAGITNQRVVYLPMRGQDTPSPREIAEVAGNEPFQSMSCLSECGPSPRFCSISHDKQVAWCSYTVTRRKLEELSHAGLLCALDGLGLTYCGQVPRQLQPLLRQELRA
jgi:organic radical activating enzyme